jgi:hypothetical protein
LRPLANPSAPCRPAAEWLRLSRFGQRESELQGGVRQTCRDPTRQTIRQANQKLLMLNYSNSPFLA